MRVGIGFDVHRLQENRKLVLGGVEIPFDKGLLGHSDADVLIHAIIDALLGALALGDIGKHFPDSDVRYLDISSIDLLDRVFERIQDMDWAIGNIDSVVMAERPKIGQYIPEMSENISKCLQVKPSQVSIKATTTEQLGFVGREEGIAAQAIVLLIRNQSPD